MPNLAIQARAQEINAVAKFQTDLHNLLALLGKEDVQVVAPGTAFTIHKASGTLSNAEVAEKALIPDSNISVDNGTVVEIAFKKYRNLVPIEKIAKIGYDSAVGGANASMIKQAQARVRSTIIAATNATGVGTASAANFKAKLAKGAAYVAKKFEDEVFTPIHFVNTDDAYDYIGSADITVQNAFGITYLENFMGLGTVILDSNITAGTIFSTACENLDVVAADITKIDGMELTTDESGLIGVHVAPAYSNGAIETVAFCGVQALPVFADRVCKVTTAA